MIKISEIEDECEQQRVKADLATPDPLDTSPIKVLYYGHSFINHYTKWEERHPELFNLGFQTDDVVMFYHGDGGACIDALLQDHNLAHVERIAPEVVIIEAGTNDISKDMFGPSLLQLKMETLIKEMKDRRVRFVVVNQVLYRGEAAYGELPKKERKMAMRLFQSKAVSFNLLCAKNIPLIPNCMYKKHPGLWKNIDQLVNRRGVHLNGAGHMKLYNSLRSAVIRVKRKIRSAKYMQHPIVVLN